MVTESFILNPYTKLRIPPTSEVAAELICLQDVCTKMGYTLTRYQLSGLDDATGKYRLQYKWVILRGTVRPKSLKGNESLIVMGFIVNNERASAHSVFVREVRILHKRFENYLKGGGYGEGIGSG